MSLVFPRFLRTLKITFSQMACKLKKTRSQDKSQKGKCSTPPRYASVQLPMAVSQRSGVPTEARNRTIRQEPIEGFARICFDGLPATFWSTRRQAVNNFHWVAGSETAIGRGSSDCGYTSHTTRLIPFCWVTVGDVRTRRKCKQYT